MKNTTLLNFALSSVKGLSPIFSRSNSQLTISKSLFSHSSATVFFNTKNTKIFNTEFNKISNTIIHIDSTHLGRGFVSYKKVDYGFESLFIDGAKFVDCKSANAYHGSIYVYAANKAHLRIFRTIFINCKTSSSYGIVYFNGVTSIVDKVCASGLYAQSRVFCDICTQETSSFNYSTVVNSSNSQSYYSSGNGNFVLEQGSHTVNAINISKSKISGTGAAITDENPKVMNYINCCFMNNTGRNIINFNKGIKNMNIISQSNVIENKPDKSLIGFTSGKYIFEACILAKNGGRSILSNESPFSLSYTPIDASLMFFSKCYMDNDVDSNYGTCSKCEITKNPIPRRLFMFHTKQYC